MCLEEGTTRASPRGGGDTRDSNSLGSGNWEGRGSRGEEGGQARGTASPPRGERRSLLAGPVGELLLSWKEARGSPDFLHHSQLATAVSSGKSSPGTWPLASGERLNPRARGCSQPALGLQVAPAPPHLAQETRPPPPTPLPLRAH